MDKNRPTTGSLVWHLALRWRAEVDRAVAPLGLTQAQYSVLASLHAMTERGRNPTQRELADYTELQPIYVSKLLRALELEGHVTRQPDSVDTRAVRVALTEQGRKTILEARRTVRALDHRLTAPLGGAEGPQTRAFAETLRMLIDHHDKTGGKP